MKKLQDFARSHPFQTVSILAVAVAAGAIIAQDHVVIGVCVFAAIYALFCLAYARNTRRLLCVALVASMLAVPRQAQAVQYALGGVVLLVAAGTGYLGCRAINCAKRIPSKRGTNQVEEFRVAGGDEYGAAFWWVDAEYCHEERSMSAPVVMTLNIFVESQTNCEVALSFDGANQVVVGLDELREELAGHGLVVPETPRISESYSRNRHPVAAEQVPIRFDWNTRTATIGAGGVPITIESSSDLTHWTPLVRINASVGAGLAIPDVSYGRSFYRVTTGGVQ